MWPSALHRERKLSRGSVAIFWFYGDAVGRLCAAFVMDLAQGTRHRPTTNTQRTTVGTTDPGTSEELPWRTTTNSDETGATATVQTGLDATAVRSVVVSAADGPPARATSSAVRDSGPTPAGRPPVERTVGLAVASSARVVPGTTGQRGDLIGRPLIVPAATLDRRGPMASVRSVGTMTGRVVMVTVRSVGTMTGRVVMVTVRSVGTMTGRAVTAIDPSVRVGVIARSGEVTTDRAVMVTVRCVLAAVTVRSVGTTIVRVVMVTVRSVGAMIVRVVTAIGPFARVGAIVLSAEVTTDRGVMVTVLCDPAAVTVHSVGTMTVPVVMVTVLCGPAAATDRSAEATTARVATATAPSAATTTGQLAAATTASGSVTGLARLELGSVKPPVTTGKTATRTAPGRSVRATRTRRSPTRSTRATCTRWHVPS
jgi:hypothetical protein